MRWIRIYLDQPLSGQDNISIEGQAARHLSQVLRLRSGDRFSAFNGDGFDYPCVVRQPGKQSVMAEIVAAAQARPQPGFHCTLAQALIKGDRMDWALQKAVELGISCIAPLITERTEVRLKEERLQKRMQHWRGVISSACEQCGRADIPQLLEPQSWYEWAQQDTSEQQLVLLPEAKQTLATLSIQAVTTAYAIGPEGGWTDAEAEAWQQQGFQGVTLGRLILRAETAALAVGSLLMLGTGSMASADLI